MTVSPGPQAGSYHPSRQGTTSSSESGRVYRAQGLIRRPFRCRGSTSERGPPPRAPAVVQEKPASAGVTRHVSTRGPARFPGARGEATFPGSCILSAGTGPPGTWESLAVAAGRDHGTSGQSGGQGCREGGPWSQGDCGVFGVLEEVGDATSCHRWNFEEF